MTLPPQTSRASVCRRVGYPGILLLDARQRSEFSDTPYDRQPNSHNGLRRCSADSSAVPPGPPRRRTGDPWGMNTEPDSAIGLPSSSTNASVDVRVPDASRT